MTSFERSCEDVAHAASLAVDDDLRPGKQRPEEGRGLRYGVSITDTCIGWGETELLLHEIAEGVRGSA